MPAIILVVIGCAALVVFAHLGADKRERAARQECFDKGGFPISKGPRSYDYHCFAQDPTVR
jgi:hypothetical protein